MNKCLVNIIDGITLKPDYSNLIENFEMPLSFVAEVGTYINTKKYHGVVKKKLIDYKQIQYDNPDHRGSVFVYLFCLPFTVNGERTQ